MPILKINPVETIEFPLVLYTPLNVNLKLENTSSTDCVAFKIKTTTPKSYLVRPSTGVVKPGESISVQIILQPLSEAPKIVNDRFLVQYVPVPDVNVSKDLWTTVNKATIQDHRLGVAFIKDPGLNIQSGNSPYGIPPKIAARLITPQNTNVDLPELRQKYDELVQYCLSVEKLKTNILKENEQLRQKLNLGPNDRIGGKIMIDLWQVPVFVILIVAVLLKVLGRI